MEYNTSRRKLTIPEYGRNVQKMISWAMEKEDKDERTKIAYIIVDIMAKSNPNVFNTGDFNHKLWDHLFLISDFKLDVDAPYPMSSKEEIKSKPQKLKYSENDIRFKHYGSNIVKMLEKATEYEEGPEKEALINFLANHLKKSYLLWNRNTVQDEMIKDHISLLSKNKINSEQYELSSTGEILYKTRKRRITNPRNNTTNGSYKPRRRTI
ncbi:MAG: DUF4290 domain-containing protein [Bacteroidales bacterium]|nr:DUF4290 domain-containing protein [Bacteroidales bacterium]